MGKLKCALIVLGILFVISCKKEDTAKVLKVVTFQPDGIAGKDAMVDGLTSVANYVWVAAPQFVANTSTSSGETFSVRSTIAFDLTSIPSTVAIDSAVLSLYAWNDVSGLGKHRGENACWLQKVTSQWDESTATWNNQPTTTTDNEVSLPKSTDPAQDYPHINVTGLIQEMIANPSKNYGMMLKLKVEQEYSTLNFVSSDYSDPARRPKLVIYYMQ